MARKPSDIRIVHRGFQPDLSRMAKALLVILGYEGPPPARRPQKAPEEEQLVEKDEGKDAIP